MIAPAAAPLVTAAGAVNESFMAKTHWELVARIAVAWALTFVLGFERQIRGAMAGDRTFSLLGAATALIGALSDHGSTTILAGAVTGIGFIGGGLCFRQTVDEHEILHGITTAASIFCAAAIGAACGLGLVKEAIACTVATLLTLELRHVPGLRALDARRWTAFFKPDHHIHMGHRKQRLIPAQTGPDTAAENAAAQTVAAEPTAASGTTSDTDAVAIAEQEAAISAVIVDDPAVPAPGPRG